MSKEEKDKIVAKARLWLTLHGENANIFARCDLCKPFIDAMKRDEDYKCEREVCTDDMKTSSDVGVCVMWAKYL